MSKKRLPNAEPAQRRTRSRSASPDQAMIQVAVYEGPTIKLLKERPATFKGLCYRPEYGVKGTYIADVLRKVHAAVDSHFLLIATDVLTGQVVAFAMCHLEASKPGVGRRNIVFLDVVCAKQGVKGAGAVLMQELDTYAAWLGASMVMLQSVLDPGTMSSYANKQFVRGVGNRSPAAVRQAQERFGRLKNRGVKAVRECSPPDCKKMAMKHVNEVLAHTPEFVVHNRFLDALQGEFYPPYNTMYSGGNSVVMYKNVRHTGGLPPEMLPGVSPVKWHNATVKYWQPGVKILGVYTRDAAGRLKKTVV